MEVPLSGASGQEVGKKKIQLVSQGPGCCPRGGDVRTRTLPKQSLEVPPRYNYCLTCGSPTGSDSRTRSQVPHSDFLACVNLLQLPACMFLLRRSTINVDFVQPAGKLVNGWDQRQGIPSNPSIAPSPSCPSCPPYSPRRLVPVD